MRLLACGDLHIGRRSSRIPEELDGRAFSCAAAWESVVAVAIRERVDAVLLSGDVVDRANRYFESIGPLELGDSALGREGIPVVAVAGNHDHDVLSRVADSLGQARLQLVGIGGRFERCTVETRSGRLHVDGWSFPREHVVTSPLETYEAKPADDAPVVGLLHADVGAAESSYAPVGVEDLRETPVAAWIVGHRHGPYLEAASGGAMVLVPGSVQAMDPREPGPHGPFVLDLDRSRDPVAIATQIPLSTVRYDEVRVDVGGLASSEELELRIVEALRGHRDAVSGRGEAEELRLLSCDLVLSGRTRLHRAIEEAADRAVADLDPGEGTVRVRVERVRRDTKPELDLEEIARGNDPAGILARDLIALEGGASVENDNASSDGEARSLVRLAQEAAGAVHGSRPYESLAGESDIDEGRARELVLDAGYELLDALIAQKDPA